MTGLNTWLRNGRRPSPEACLDKMREADNGVEALSTFELRCAQESDEVDSSEREAITRALRRRGFSS